MKKAAIGDEDVAERVSKRLGDKIDRSTISRIRRGTRNPSIELMRAIFDVTAGAVTANDFVHDEAAD